MATTYELYTNENGTPKAVEGKAPAIIERVEALEADVKTLDEDIGNIQTEIEVLEGKAPAIIERVEALEADVKTLDEDIGNIQTEIEVLEGGVVKTINGETPDQAGNIDIPVGHNVGEEWVSYTGKIPNGGVPYCGQIVTRATYADLWSYAQAQGLVKSESEWQAWASSHGGNVPYYSSGNGSTTFRMPKIVGYVKGASSQSESGSYIAEGLPDHKHYLTNTNSDYYSYYGTNYVYTTSTAKQYVNQARDKIGYASEDNPIYGNSNHVTPETNVVLFGVFAFGNIINVGELDAETLATGLAKVEANLEAKLDKTTAHIVETWVSGMSWYRKWSDGWIEQGGWVSDTESWTNRTKIITLHKAFSNTKYNITLGDVMRSADSYMGDGNSGVESVSTSRFVVWIDDMTGGFYWHACGK